MLKRTLCALITLVFCAACFPCAAGAQLTEYDLAVYRDKTIAGMLGQVAGLLSGFEFVWKDGKPWVPLPEEWFCLMNGPYGNGPAYGGAGVERILPQGIASDDDYHIDFFNQLILQTHGPMPTNEQIMAMWRAYKVSDWGGGSKAMDIMRRQKLAPPYCGLYEYGNYFHWCTEPYIENETLGMNAPGMPQTAWQLSGQFAAVTGDFESLEWARFWAAVYAMAYVYDDADSMLRDAAGALLPGSWPRRIAEMAIGYYDAGMQWEEAVAALETQRREIYQADNIQCAADVNNGFGLLSILYGGGDWLQTVKLASISGYDADCTAATVGGVLGILKGTGGLPQEVMDTIWQNGEGVYYNDRNFVPHVGGDYPDQETFAAIAERYIANGVSLVKAKGGHADAQTLYIPMEKAPSMQGIQPQNADFEAGSLTGWLAEGGAAQAMSGANAHSGGYYAALKLDSDTLSGSLTMEIPNLIPGEWYRLSGYVMTSFDGEARLTAESGQSSSYAGVLNANKGWILREVIFQAETEQLKAGIMAVRQPEDGATTVYLDDMRLERLEPVEIMGSFGHKTLMEKKTPYSVEISVPKEGDWYLRIPYSCSGPSICYADVEVDGVFSQRIPFSPTSLAPDGAGHAAAVTLRLSQGAHTVSIIPTRDGIMVYGLEITTCPRVMLNGIM